MTDNKRLQAEFLKGNSFGPFISSIVFPGYKNLSPGEEITFDFPLTLLLGKNGANKSSVLHALYGCPDGKSTGEYWFSTHVDEIAEKEKQAYFYRYTIPKMKQTAEVLKTMIKKAGDLDYWEPSRPIMQYGMSKMPSMGEDKELDKWRSKSRWNAIKKEVLYLDFRAEISAFDKAFYKDRYSPTSRVDHRNKLRKQSKPLKDAIKKNRQTRNYFRKERIFINSRFDEKMLRSVNSILGSAYTEVIYLEHDFYHSNSFTVYLKSESGQSYSEAFAGSGETSVVRLVYALENAQDNALVLLDEPETSLHIEAQYALRDFVIDKINEKKLQVVMSTHSPFFAKGLPETAIKVLHKNPITKKIEIINKAPAEESSFHVGFRRRSIDKLTVFVEDSLAKALCEHVSKEKLSESEADQFQIDIYPGGKDELLKMAAFESLKENSNTAFLFDGDCAPCSPITDPDTIPASENDKLDDLLSETFRTNSLHFPRDSGQPDKKFENIRNIFRFARGRFSYLPCETPEQFLIAESPEFNLTDVSSSDAKEIIADHVKEKLSSSGSVTSIEILTVQRLLLQQIDSQTPVFSEIATTLKELVKSTKT